MLSRSLLQVLACPSCHGGLESQDHSFACTACGTQYPWDQGRPDLRLRNPKKVPVEFTLGVGIPQTQDVAWTPLQRCPKPEVDFDGEPVPNHLSRAVLSHFPKASAPGRLMLDIGCGTALHHRVCERAGFEYAGLDYSNPGAPMLGDAHALPFRDECFDFVLSIAVLEHIQFPEVMLREVFRVLKPGGRFIGSASFLEPFHEISYQHHSHMGLLSVLRQAGFEVKAISPGWDGATAITQMSLLAGAPSWAVKLAVAPLLVAHRVWWKLLSTLRPGWDETTRRLKSAGAFSFIVDRPQVGECAADHE